MQTEGYQMTTMTLSLAQAAMRPAAAPLVDHLPHPHAELTQQHPTNATNAAAAAPEQGKGHPRGERKSGEEGCNSAILNHNTAHHPQ